MDFEEVHRLGLLGYDEKTETWYVQAKDSQRLMLTRQSLGRLVQMYNSVHTGNSLVLLEARELRRVEEALCRHSAALRDAHLELDRHRKARFWNRLRGLWPRS